MNFFILIFIFLFKVIFGSSIIQNENLPSLKNDTLFVNSKFQKAYINKGHIFDLSKALTCYSYTKDIHDSPDYVEKKIKCSPGDNCVKAVFKYSSHKGIFKGCSTEYFIIRFGNIGTRFVPNTCISGKYISQLGDVEETLCGCNNKDLCNSGSKTLFIPIFFALIVFFILKF